MSGGTWSSLRIGRGMKIGLDNNNQTSGRMQIRVVILPFFYNFQGSASIRIASNRNKVDEQLQSRLEGTNHAVLPIRLKVKDANEQRPLQIAVAELLRVQRKLVPVWIQMVHNKFGSINRDPARAMRCSKK